MRRSGMAVWVLATMVILVTVSGCTSSTPIPKVENIGSAEINLGVPVKQGDPLPSHLDPAKLEDRAVIEKVLGWLSAAKVVGKGREPFPEIGHHVLSLHLKNGKLFSVGVSYQEKGQVVFDMGDGEPLHLAAPEMANWLSDGWKQDMKLRLEGVPKADEITAAYIPGQPKMPRWRLNTEAIPKVVGWLQTAEVTSGETNPTPASGGWSPYLVLELNVGGTITVRPAADCVSTKQSNGNETTICNKAEGQVILNRDGKATRLRAPELAVWVSEGWEKDVWR